MQPVKPFTQNVASVYASKLRMKHHSDDDNVGKPGNSGPGKPEQNMSGSTPRSMGASHRGSPSASLTTAPHGIPSPTSTIIVASPTAVTAATLLPPKKSNQQIMFNDPQNVTTCGTLQLSWVHGGQAVVPMTLVVQNQTILNDPGTTNGPQITHILTNNTSSYADRYLWFPVDVDEGWYLVKAYDAGASLDIFAQSATFFVSRGPDLRCLPSNGINGSAPTLPPTHTSGRGTLRTSDVIGISLGVTIGVVVLLLAYLFPRLWHRDLPDSKNRRPYLLY
uniref:Uncharacterized protein n=1 Tax=Psilocybe cubensis TaxID=181762 RepID=A0A8H8CN66_PSICU